MKGVKSRADLQYILSSHEKYLLEFTLSAIISRRRLAFCYEYNSSLKFLLLNWGGGGYHSAVKNSGS